jgi:hypothetical protein
VRSDSESEECQVGWRNAHDELAYEWISARKEPRRNELISGGIPSTQSTLTQKSPLQKDEGSLGNMHYGGLRLNI